MVFWGPIIGAGISAIGSLFGKGEEQKTTTEVDYVKMAANAEKAGFNPLTAIRNGGSAGFTTTSHPGLSMMAGIGEAFGTIGNALMAFDPRADERAALEEKLMRAQLHRIETGQTKQSMWSMDVPTAARSTVVTASGGSTTAAAQPPPLRFNQTRNWGTSVAAPFEPKTEYDEFIAGIDQITSDVKRAWEKDPVHEWYKRVSGPQAVRPSYDIFTTPSGVPGQSPRHWNLPANRGW